MVSSGQRFRELVPLRNPLILASGPLGHNAATLLKFGHVAGAIVGKSVTWLPQKGNPQPRIARFKRQSMLNWEDFPNPGYVQFAEELTAAKRVGICPIIGSISPLEDLDQIRTIAVTLQDAGAEAIELNYKWGAKQRDKLVYAVTRGVKSVVKIPVIAKLSPFVGDIVANARLVEEAGADAVTAINSIYPAMHIDVKLRRPVLSSGIGGLSGESILPVAVAMIYQIFEVVKIPILGSGGVVSGEDAVEQIMAGAEAVQICTVAMIEGPASFTRILQEMDALKREFQVGQLDEWTGVAHEYKLHVPQSATAAGDIMQKHWE